MRSVGEWTPPSEKESGVKFKMAMTRVRRLGSSALSEGECWEKGVAVDKAVEVGGRASR